MGLFMKLNFLVVIGAVLIYYQFEDLSTDVYGKKEWHNVTDVDLNGKVAIVTGSSSGIGRALVTELYKKGCTVVITSRSQKRSDAAARDTEKDVKSEGATLGGKLDPVAFDLSDLNDVRRFVKYFTNKYDRLDYLSANAGMLLNGYTGPWISKQGYDMLYAANYLGHFLLAQELLPMLKKSNGRIVATSSIAQWIHTDDLDSLLPVNNKESNENTGGFSQFEAYGNSKLLLVFMCFEMQRRHPDVGCTPVAPGFVKSKIGTPSARESNPVGDWFVIAVDAAFGAQTSVEALLGKDGASPKDGGQTGVFVQPYYAPPIRNVPKQIISAKLFRLLSISVVLFEFALQFASWGNHKWVAHPDAYNEEFAFRLWVKSVEACELS